MVTTRSSSSALLGRQRRRKRTRPGLPQRSSLRRALRESLQDAGLQEAPESPADSPGYEDIGAPASQQSEVPSQEALTTQEVPSTQTTPSKDKKSLVLKLTIPPAAPHIASSSPLSFTASSPGLSPASTHTTSTETESISTSPSATTSDTVISPVLPSTPVAKRSLRKPLLPLVTAKEERGAGHNDTGDPLSPRKGWWCIKEIITESRLGGNLQYLVDWEGIDPDTGGQWPSSWVKEKDITPAAIQEWKTKQAMQTVA